MFVREIIGYAETSMYGLWISHCTRRSDDRPNCRWVFNPQSSSRIRYTIRRFAEAWTGTASFGIVAVGAALGFPVSHI